MKKLLTAGVATIAMAGTAMAAAKMDSIKVGVVNPVIIYQQAPQGEASIQALQKKLQPKAKELQNEQNELVKKMQTLQTNAPTLTQTDLNAQKAKLEQAQKDFQQKANSFRQSEATQEQEIAKAFQSQFGDAVNQVAKKDGYQLILSSQAVAYAAPELKVDVTSDVVEIMKSATPTKKDDADKADTKK
ncbi:OmpH family outer membrane protein [Fangia hongkongensis]|uniref:OmpH family outer membrane protein n=1 Tax=Fangia hongkongensis TaxID=270495 RepID=UPI0003814865|nr:OmpH family outer membrane protein [Fangia hongkongensis]MBK2126176.1 OmpH family outer membrane protein [Fangia hongkongensis]